MTISAVKGNLWRHGITIRPFRFNLKIDLQKILIEFTHCS